MMHRIHLLGGLQVFTAHNSLRIAGEKSQNLLAYLLLHAGRPAHRELLAEILFPDAAPERGRRSLSATLARLQAALESEWLRVEKDHLLVRGGGALWVDVWEFERLSASSALTDLQKAVDLYAGDLLPELYDDWILPRRELLRNQYLSILEKLAARYEQQGELRQALLITRRLILAEPLHEPANLEYLRQLGRLRRYGEAAAHFEYLRQLLQNELGVEPMDETRQVAQAIESERALATAQIVNQENTEFVGRIPERKLVLEAVEGVFQGTGGILVVEGVAGIGKSRFLREIAAGARWRGIEVMMGQASETPVSSPFEPLVEVLHPIFNGPRMAQLETLLSAGTLDALAPLAPGIAPGSKLPDAPSEQAGRRFFDALELLGETLARLLKLVLIIDDVQWADRTLWQSLRALALGLARGGGLLLLAYRRPEIESTPGWAVIRDWYEAGALKVVALQPLSLDDVTRLVAGHATADPAEIYALTGGSPFLIGQWLAEPVRAPSDHQITFSAFIKGLSPLAREMVEYAAVLGDTFPYRMWLEVAGTAPLTLASAGDELIARQWLVHAAEGYQFAHDLIRQAIYAEIEPARRAKIHARVALALQRDDPENHRSRAFHLDMAGMALEAAGAYRKAGEKDLSRYAISEAIQAFDRALALMPDEASIERVETALALAQACEITGDRDRQQPALQEAGHGARRLGDDALLLRVLFVMGRALGQISQIQEAQAYLAEALTLAKKLRDRSRETDIVFEFGDLAAQAGRWNEAEPHFHRAYKMARTGSDPAREARAIVGLGIAAIHTGNPRDAVKWFEQALAIHRQAGNRLGEVHVQSNMVGAYYELGAWDRLMQTAAEVLPVSEALGNRVKTAVTRHAYGLAAYALGDYQNARQLIAQAEREFISVGNRRNAGLTRNALGLVAEDEGSLDEALELYRSALASAEELDAAGEAAYARHDLGALLLRLDQPHEAIPLLESSRAIWIEQGNLTLRVKSEAFLGLAQLAVGSRPQAEALAAANWEVFQKGVPVGEQVQGWLWALYRLLLALDRRADADAVLKAAYAELQRQAGAVSDHELRRSFFERVPLNRSILAAYDACMGTERVTSVSLARLDSPLGRPLETHELVRVRWTVSAPEDDAITSKDERRRQRILRLLREAEQQGAAPTDSDLAAALGVSRRTILRDMQALSASLPAAATRKRLRQQTAAK